MISKCRHINQYACHTVNMEHLKRDKTIPEAYPTNIANKTNPQGITTKRQNWNPAVSWGRGTCVSVSDIGRVRLGLWFDHSVSSWGRGSGLVLAILIGLGRVSRGFVTRRALRYGTNTTGMLAVRLQEENLAPSKCKPPKKNQGNLPRCSSSSVAGGVEGIKRLTKVYELRGARH